MRFLAPLFGLLVLVAIATQTTSCRKDLGKSDGALEFSVDTVIFDTVFTTIGSTTKRFMIYNRDNRPVTINSVHLAGGADSKYRINIDGVAGVAFSNIEIPGADSLFVFVEVTLDPNNQLDPAMVTDSVVFNTNGVTQDVDLAACGWDAHFIYPTINSNIGPISYVNCDTTWTGSGKPIVIYGFTIIDSLCTLTIQPGTQVYIHKYSGLIADAGASLQIFGSVDNPVKIQSDRLDEFYVDQAGEWDRIWLFAGSRNNIIENAIIKNGSIGLQVDSIDMGSGNPTLEMKNVVIENMAAASLFTIRGPHINAYNCVFGNAGQYSAALIGGKYDFRHCTFGNHWNAGNRETPALQINNWFEQSPGVIRVWDLEDAYFGNCIISGNRTNEILVDPNGAAQFSFQFENSLIKVDQEEIDISNQAQFTNCLVNEDPKFKDPSEQNFELDTLSPAKDAGDINITNFNLGALGTDVLGNSRTSDSAPDLGAYERQE